jgi:hypothetical protein
MRVFGQKVWRKRTWRINCFRDSLSSKPYLLVTTLCWLERRSSKSDSLSRNAVFRWFCLELSAKYCQSLMTLVIHGRL